MHMLHTTVLILIPRFSPIQDSSICCFAKGGNAFFSTKHVSAEQNRPRPFHESHQGKADKKTMFPIPARGTR
jgi:hypothetical protein